MIEEGKTAQAPAAEVVTPLRRIESTSVTYEPTLEQMETWQAKARRIAPFGPARQLVVAFEVEVWANDDRVLAPLVAEALQAYIDEGKQVENGAEVVRKNGVVLRHRYLNRYYVNGKLDSVMPDQSEKPAVVAVNAGHLNA